MANTLRQPKTISAQTFLKQQVASLKCGLLRKKKAGIHFGCWPLRFVVISSGYIYCYKNEHAEEPKSTFSLEEFNYVEKDANKDNQWRILSTPKPEQHKVLTFACVSDNERKGWVDAVNREILSLKNKSDCETDDSEEHFYDDIDEEVKRSPGPLGLNTLLKSKPIKALTHVVAKRYHDLRLGGTSDKESSTKLDILEPHVSDEQVWSQAPEIPPARTLPASLTGPPPDLPPGPIPPRMAKKVFEKDPPPLPPNGLLRPSEDPLSQETVASPTCPRKNAPPPPKPPEVSNVKDPPPLPPNGLLRPSEEPLSQETVASPTCPRKNAPPPPKPPRSGVIPAWPEKEAQPPSNQAPSPPSLTEPEPESEQVEGVSPPIIPRLPAPRLVISGEHRGGDDEYSDPDEHVYVNIEDMYMPYEFPPARRLEDTTLVDLCLISDPSPDRVRLNSILMSTGEYGTYFVRCSRKGDQKVLAFFSKAHKVNEYKIFEEGGLLTLDQNTKTPSFDTLESLLEFYTSTGLLIETDEHLGQGIHEIVDVKNAKLSNKSNT